MADYNLCQPKLNRMLITHNVVPVPRTGKIIGLIGNQSLHFNTMETKPLLRKLKG